LGNGESFEPLPGPPVPARFPWAEIAPVAVLVLFHLWLAGVPGLRPFGGNLVRDGALLAGATAREPWRLVTAMFLHADPPHVLWNALSMAAFGVPLLTQLGSARTGLVYLASGVGGGLTALAFAEPGTAILGSSGAVAGLFGAWIALRLDRARDEDLSGRARVRTIGIALLVLPSFLTPQTASGRPISVSSHLGGLATGMLVGAALSRLLRRSGAPVPPEADRYVS
jgi:membrane associated rhomboid family serine protease